MKDQIYLYRVSKETGATEYVRFTLDTYESWYRLRVHTFHHSEWHRSKEFKRTNEAEMRAFADELISTYKRIGYKEME